MCTAITVFDSDDDIAAYMRGEEINPELPGMPKEFMEYQKSLLEKSNRTVYERYDGKNGGYVRIHKQNKNERAANLTTYKILADDGGKYRLITPSDTKKSPDAYNEEKKWYSDAKNTHSTNGKNVIQNSIKNASKQGVEEVVIRTSIRIPSFEIYSGLKASLQPGRAMNLKQIILIRENNKPVYLDVEKLKNRFKK